MGLFFKVSWVHDDGHARSLRSLRIACSIPLLADCFAACSSLLIPITMTLNDSHPMVARVDADQDY